jgi:hypothetical protein
MTSEDRDQTQDGEMLAPLSGEPGNDDLLSEETRALIATVKTLIDGGEK